MQKIPRIDIGMIGEGEPSFELLLFGTYSPARVPGIIWRKNGSLVVNASLNNAVSPKLSMDRIPVPDTNAFDPKAYTRGNSYVAPIGIEAICGAVTACIPFWAEPGCGFAALKKLWMRCKCLPKNSTLTCFTLQTAW